MTVIKIALRYIRNEILVLPTRVIVVLFCLTLLLLPLFTRDLFILRILALASIFAIYAASWDLLSGFVGQINLGHALFFGSAAYTSALLNLRLGFPPIIAIPVGALVAVLVGLLVGIPCLRLKGPYLGLATMAFPIMLVGIIFAFPGFFGGELGISGLTRLAPTRLSEYYITVII
ncbi:MAG TPA: branched-chain amino acid ABC transporter permease, partial [Candidatus Limnocylindrales bacterium]|nr:branched-chain amino acid ABC transporter permease [Candidatus Limnocylindrales bacterium]